MAYKRLGDILLSAKVVTEEQLENALRESKESGLRLGEYLIKKGLLTEHQLIDVLRLQLGVDFVDLNDTKIPMEMARLVPKNIARTEGVIPVKTEGNTVYLAMKDPLNFRAISTVRKLTGKRVIPMIAEEEALTKSIATLYGNESVAKAITDLQESITDSGLVDDALSDAVSYNSTDEEAAPTIRLVNSFLERAIAEKASDVHIEPRADGLCIRMRIDGVLHTMLTIPTSLQNAVISRIKIMGDMDIAERRIPQDGRAQLRIKDKDYDMRISTLPNIYGEKVVIRFLEKSASLLTSDGIGLVGEHLKDYESLIHNANGVILISGPTGSGKSTTMYTMIAELANDEINVTTLEDPIEYNINGVNQVQVNEKAGMNFANGLRAILRQDPDIIGVGEIRDEETAEIAMRAAITGHLVLSTIHTNSAIATLDRLLDIGIEPYLIASALKGVVSQRLVRKICPNCKEAYKPSDEELSALNISPEQGRNLTFYRGCGCSECLNTGYRGRTGVFEILTLTRDVKELFRDRAPHKEIVDEIMRSNFKPLLVDARKLVLNGTTTVSEAQKILHTTDD